MNTHTTTRTRAENAGRTRIQARKGVPAGKNTQRSALLGERNQNSQVTAASEQVTIDKDVSAMVNQFKNCFTTTDENVGVENIDIDDGGNPQLVADFVNPIYQYMLHVEKELGVTKNYMEDTDLRPKMRTILVDWLIQVHHRFQLMQETLYLTIAVVDRFLQADPVQKNELQLVGVTAMHIAAKYEEMYAPEIADYAFVSDDSVQRDDILGMEMRMLKSINFKLGRPLPLHFLRRNSKAGNVESRHHFMAKYLMELSQIDYELSHVEPSKIAAASLCLSLRLMDDLPWTNTLEFYSRYSKDALMPVICQMAKNLIKSETCGFRKFTVSKYSSHKLMKIAKHIVLEEKAPLLARLASRADYATL